MALQSNFPIAQGLYDPANEHDACGVAMVATLNKIPTHEIVEQGLRALRNLEHRGASGAEPDSGDGAGILIRVPDKYFRRSASLTYLPLDFMQRELHLLKKALRCVQTLKRLHVKKVCAF